MPQSQTKFQIWGNYNGFVLQNIDNLANNWYKLKTQGYDHSFKFYTCGIWDDMI